MQRRLRKGTRDVHGTRARCRADRWGRGDVHRPHILRAPEPSPMALLEDVCGMCCARVRSWPALRPMPTALCSVARSAREGMPRHLGAPQRERRCHCDGIEARGLLPRPCARVYGCARGGISDHTSVYARIRLSMGKDLRSYVPTRVYTDV